MSKSKINIFSNVFGIVAALGLISVIAASYYYVKIENERASHFKSNIEHINQLMHLNSKWSSSVEDTRSFALIDFDQIAHYTKMIRAKLAELDESGLLDADKAGAETVQEYNVFKNSFEVKYEAIERYKSGQAVLRNSVNYLLPSLNEALSVASNDSIKKDLSALAASLDRFLLLKTNKSLEAVVTNIDRLKNDKVVNSNSYTGDIIKTFVSHANIIVEYTPRVVSMLEAAKNVDIHTLTENLATSYLDYQGVSAKQVSYWQKIMLYAFGGLLVIFGMFLIRSRRNTKKALLKEEELKEANVKIDTVHDDIIYSEQLSGRATLALATVDTIMKHTSSISYHIGLLQKVNESDSEMPKSATISKLISDLKFQEEEMAQLNFAVESDKKNSVMNVSFTTLVEKALLTLENELSWKPDFNLQLSKDSHVIKARPIDIFQIVLKLLRMTVYATKDGEDKLNLYLKTWATDNFVNLYITVAGHSDLNEIFSGKGMSIIKDLLSKNNVLIEIKSFSTNNGTITLNVPHSLLTDSVIKESVATIDLTPKLDNSLEAITGA